MERRALTTLTDDSDEAYVIEADGEDANQYYVTGYHAPDPFASIYTSDGLTVLTSSLEYTRAKDDSLADEVVRYAEFGYGAYLEEHGRRVAKARTLAAFLEDRSVATARVPPSFPLATARELEAAGISVIVDDEGRVEAIRARKTPTEVEYIARAQQANEAAMAAAEELLRAADIDGDVLVYDGDVLTAERMRQHIELTLLEHGCALDNCIVGCGADAARAHEYGSGPLRPDINITIDIFPRDKETLYNADMTRTFVKGEAPDKIRAWYSTVEEAFEAALEAIEPGTTGAAVHDAVCDVFEAAGYPTLRTDETTEDGFFHSTGHGIGLEVHEPPSLGSAGGELEPGHVVTVEPGLYEQGYGGVRIEDLVVVTEDGYRNLTDYHTRLELD